MAPLSFDLRLRARWPLGAGLALALATSSLGCEERVPVIEAPASVPAKLTSKRPPFPNMATASWGAKVMEERAEGADDELVGRGYKAALELALRELHSLDEGGEARAARAAVAAWRAAQADPERSTAAALLAAALVLDPAAEGYKERLTDAHGLAAYAGTLEPGTVLSQTARAFVAIAAGRVHEGKKLVDVIASGPGLEADGHLLLGLSRLYLAERTDEAIGHLRAAAKDKPESQRARAALAEMLLELGLPGLAVEALDVPGCAPNPFLDALKGRALVRSGRRDEGLRLLRDAEGKLPEARRGLALYWLGRSLVEAGDAAGAGAALAKLAGRPGYASEAALLEAIVAKHTGDLEKARARSQRLCQSRGAPFQVAVDCQWVLVETCAAQGDRACVERWGPRAMKTDGDRARLARARATLAVGGKAEGVDVEAALLDAHLLSPFDPGLAEQAKAELVPGGVGAEVTVRGARRALLLGAPQTAALALEPLVKKSATCRVCRALYALAARRPDIDEAARRAVKALEGKGPPLAEDDLVALIDVLGGSPLDAGEKALDALAKDPRPAVQKAVAEAKADLKDPERRKRREEEERHEHDEAPGTVPVPSLAPTGGAPGGAR